MGVGIALTDELVLSYVVLCSRTVHDDMHKQISCSSTLRFKFCVFSQMLLRYVQLLSPQFRLSSAGLVQPTQRVELIGNSSQGRSSASFI